VPTYVTGPEILTAAGVGTGDAAEQAWATTCAAAVQAAIDTRMADVTVEASSDADDELQRAAVIDGVAAYLAKDAPQGVLNVGPDGAPVRVSADVLRACVPVIERHHPTAGIGIG
jgi:hypothetical protein